MIQYHGARTNHIYYVKKKKELTTYNKKPQRIHYIIITLKPGCKEMGGVQIPLMSKPCDFDKR